MIFDTYLDMGELGEQDVTVHYDYTPGCKGSWDEPPMYPEAEITKVLWRGVDVQQLLGKESIEHLQQEAFDDVTGGINQALEDAAEARYFDRRAA